MSALGVELLGVNAATARGSTPEITEPVLAARYEEAIEPIDANRGYLSGPSSSGRREVLRMFSLLGAGAEAVLEAVLEALRDGPETEALAERFAPCVENGTLADFAVRAEPLPARQHDDFDARAASVPTGRRTTT